ncbi:MAG: SufS family cysteine desulfurase [Actinobacteria bacterium]|nr:SufS family cysteine desulfurase [Actinomycetota bacterium]
MSLDVESLRKDFPIFETQVHGKPLIYLDSASSSQKPRQVVDRMVRFYETEYANVHRGVYDLSERATAAYEGARAACARFVGARDPRSIIFTRGTTEGINLVRFTWARANVKAGDEILVTEMEHHSNLVPWQLLAQEVGASLRHLPVDDEGLLRIDLLDEYITERTKVVAVSLMSNVLGTINPVRALADAAHAAGARIVVDAAQAAPHIPIDVNELDVDFLAYSSHKMLGPTGAGALYGRLDLLEEMPPFHGGGEMIREVFPDHSTWAEVPHKFEAGTPNIAQAVGMGAAVEYLEGLGMGNVRAHEKEMVDYGISKLEEAGAKVYGPKDISIRGGVASFNLDEVHPHDMATILDQEGLCIRAGHHCAQPLMRVLGVPATARASFYVYNTPDEIDALVGALDKAKGWFA